MPNFLLLFHAELFNKMRPFVILDIILKIVCLKSCIILVKWHFTEYAKKDKNILKLALFIDYIFLNSKILIKMIFYSY